MKASMTGALLQNPPKALTNCSSVPALAYADYKSRRDGLSDTLLPTLALAVHASNFLALDGLPYPIQYRNRGALNEWRRLFGAAEWSREVWATWAETPATCLDCINELSWQLERQSGQFTLSRPTASWSDVMFSNAVKWAANIHYERKSGALIETTPALDALLMHSDLNETVPMRMFSPPFRAQYLRLHRNTAEQLASPEDRAKQRWIDGVFCFVSKPESSCNPTEFIPVIELVIVYHQNGQGIATRMLHGPLIDQDESIIQWVDAILLPQQGRRTAQDDSEVKLINYMAKVFLYLGLKEARRHASTEHSAALARLAEVGPKKRARLQRQLASLYDRITVGPADFPMPMSTGQDALSRTPHWRRGHFRSQPCGPARSARKLIFVAPVLIHADRLDGETPRPKTYALTEGQRRSEHAAGG